jgi:hypothetical protein
MEVADRLEEIRHFTEILVDVDLFKECLLAPIRVFLVFFLRSMEEDLPPSFDMLTLKNGLALGILVEGDRVTPHRQVFLVTDPDADKDVSMPAGSQTAEPGYSTTLPDCLLKPPSYCHQVVKETEDVEEIRFPGGVGADQESPP